MATIESIALVSDTKQHRIISDWFSCTGNPTSVHYAKEPYLASLESGSEPQLAFIGKNDNSIETTISLLEETARLTSNRCFLAVLAHSASEAEIATTLYAGADRFITNTESRAINNARILALVKPLLVKNKIESYPPYTINQMTNEVTIAGNRIVLTPSEFRIAKYLFDNHGTILSREIMLREIWGLPNLEYSRRVDTKISHIRKKMHLDGTYGWHLKYPRGKGYQLEQPDRETASA